MHGVARLVSPRNVAIVVNRAHREFYDRMVGVPSASIVAQPCNRGTVPAILYGLRRLANLGRNTVVAVFPCDHFFENCDRSICYVEEAMAAVEASASMSVVLGMDPTSSDNAFGWIEPGESVCPIDPLIFRIRRFWKSPPVELAPKLIHEGWLWNSLIIVARAPRLQEMIAECLPAVYVEFNMAFASFRDDSEWMAIDKLYRNMGTYGFSQEILTRCPPNLAVKHIDGVEQYEIIAQETHRHLANLPDRHRTVLTPATLLQCRY